MMAAAAAAAAGGGDLPTGGARVDAEGGVAQGQDRGGGGGDAGGQGGGEVGDSYGVDVRDDAAVGGSGAPRLAFRAQVYHRRPMSRRLMFCDAMGSDGVRRELLVKSVEAGGPLSAEAFNEARHAVRNGDWVRVRGIEDGSHRGECSVRADGLRPQGNAGHAGACGHAGTALGAHASARFSLAPMTCASNSARIRALTSPLPVSHAFPPRRRRNTYLLFRQAGDGEMLAMVLVDDIEVVQSYRETHPGTNFVPQPFGVHAPTAAGGDGGQKRPFADGNAGEAEPRAPCKFWINTGSCARGDACRFEHDPAARGKSAAKSQWVAARRARRQQAAAAAGDPHAAAGGAKRKSARARMFVSFAVETLGIDTLRGGSGVLDVAGGRGEVSFEFKETHGVPSTVVDPRPPKLSKLQHKAVKARGGAKVCACARAGCCACE